MHADLRFVGANRWAVCAVLTCSLAAPPAYAADGAAASSPPSDTAVPMPQTPLDARWVLLNLGHAQIRKPKGAAQEPFMTLSATPNTAASGAAPTPRSGKLEGFGGCNQLTGRFELDGARLTFGPGIGMTRMACPDRAALDLESRFAQALQACARWRIVNGGLDGPALELLDETGTMLARFIAPQPRR